MKRLQWTTTSEYVDKDTGEQLTKQEVDEKYIITNKIKHRSTYEKYIPTKHGGYILTKFGLTTITNECTRNGKQIKLF